MEKTNEYFDSKGRVIKVGDRVVCNKDGYYDEHLGEEGVIICFDEEAGFEDNNNICADINLDNGAECCLFLYKIETPLRS